MRKFTYLMVLVVIFVFAVTTVAANGAKSGSNVEGTIAVSAIDGGAASAVSQSQNVPTCEAFSDGNFDADDGSWVESSAGGFALIYDANDPPGTASPSGGNVAWLGGADAAVDSICQTIFIPSGLSATLQWQTNFLGYIDTTGSDADTVMDMTLDGTTVFSLNWNQVWPAGTVAAGGEGFYQSGWGDFWTAPGADVSAWADDSNHTFCIVVSTAFDPLNTNNDSNAMIIDDVTLNIADGNSGACQVLAVDMQGIEVENAATVPALLAVVALLGMVSIAVLRRTD